MAVGIDIYRRQVGIFNLRRKAVFSVKTRNNSEGPTIFKGRKYANNRISAPLKIGLVILIWLCQDIHRSQLATITQETNNYDSIRLGFVISEKCSSTSVCLYMMGMNWMYCNKAPNCLAHSLNGNRRNIGYNYFLWNWNYH